MKRLLRKILCSITRVSSHKKGNTIFFVRRRFERLMDGICSEYNCCLLNPRWTVRDYLRYLLHGIHCYVNDEWKLEDFYEYNSSGIKSYNSLDKIQYAKKNIRKIFEKENVKLIILDEDMLPNNTTLVEVAKELRIPSVTYMHGVLSPKCDFKFGCHTDYFWVWGQYFKDRYINYNLKNSKDIFVMGYPDNLKKNTFWIDEKSVLFIGIGYTEWRYPELMDGYAYIARRIANICEELGIQFIYRPHPSEDFNSVKKRFSDYPSVKISHKRNLYRDLKRFRYVVGGVSTAMVEAAMAGNTIVLINFDISKDDDIDGIKYFANDNIFELDEYIDLLKSGIYKSLPAGQCDSYYIKQEVNYVENIKKEIVHILEKV